MEFSRRATFAFGFAAAVLGCESAASRACSGEYAQSQQKVLAVDKTSAESVQASLDAVKSALAACRAAQHNTEVDNLVTARNQLSAQLDALERRAQRKPRRELTPDELARLEKEGDPACPKGQSYHLENKKDVKCTGPQIAEMPRADVKRYFEERGYRVKESAPNEVKVERGAELYTFRYPSAAAADRPSCVVLVPPQGMPWKEALARATAMRPEKMEAKGTVTVLQGALPYEVDEKNVVVRIGVCQK